ncbi:MAG TPA: hypothetical protein VJR87_07145 [Allosphingosinicella sp.]|nr:hypothetical protein [Allosphingosinicella sp.]
MQRYEIIIIVRIPRQVAPLVVRLLRDVEPDDLEIGTRCRDLADQPDGAPDEVGQGLIQSGAVASKGRTIRKTHQQRRQIIVSGRIFNIAGPKFQKLRELARVLGACDVSCFQVQDREPSITDKSIVPNRRFRKRLAAKRLDGKSADLRYMTD